MFKLLARRRKFLCLQTYRQLSSFNPLQLSRASHIKKVPNIMILTWSSISCYSTFITFIYTNFDWNYWCSTSTTVTSKIPDSNLQIRSMFYRLTVTIAAGHFCILLILFISYSKLTTGQSQFTWAILRGLLVTLYQRQFCTTLWSVYVTNYHFSTSKKSQFEFAFAKSFQ